MKTCRPLPKPSEVVRLSDYGLPVGLQIIGRKFRDGDVLAAAKTFEDLHPWRDLYQIPFGRQL